MSNLYKFHTHPELLLGKGSPYIVPIIAYELAVQLHRMKAECEPEIEDTILKDPDLAAMYAYQTTKKRWPDDEDEEFILEFAKLPNAVGYAKLMDDGRHADLEKRLFTPPYDTRSMVKYAGATVTGPWPAMEEILIKSKAYLDVARYADDVINGRWYEGEHMLTDDAGELLGTPHLTEDIIFSIYNYATQVIKGRWEDAEDIFLALIRFDPKDKVGGIRWVMNYWEDVFIDRETNRQLPWPELRRELHRAGRREEVDEYDEWRDQE